MASAETSALPADAEPPVLRSVGILHEDDDLLVADKPGNLPCHPGGRYCGNTLLHILRARGGDVGNLRIINRLDRETSGIVLVAKTDAMVRSLAGQFRRHTAQKEYTVLVHGAFPAHLEARGWLLPDTGSAIRKKRRFVTGDAPPTPGAESAETDFELVEARDGISRVLARPRTGRTHQIRATLFSLGFPVVGDKIYGLDETFFLRFIADALTDADRARLMLPRQALHASALTVVIDGARRTFTSPPPF